MLALRFGCHVGFEQRTANIQTIEPEGSKFGRPSGPRWRCGACKPSPPLALLFFGVLGALCPVPDSQRAPRLQTHDCVLSILTFIFRDAPSRLAPRPTGLLPSSDDRTPFGMTPSARLQSLPRTGLVAQ